MPMWYLSFENFDKADMPRILKKVTMLNIQTLVASTSPYILANNKKPNIIK